MKKTSILIATAIAMFAAPAMAQTLPTLTEEVKPATQEITTTVKPACELLSTLSNPTINLGVGAVATGAATINVGNITVTCNTPNSSVLVGSKNLSNETATILQADSRTFTSTVSFVARVFAPNWGVDSRAGFLNGTTAWPSAAAISVGLPNRRILNANVDIVNLSSAGLLPVAGTYTGSVCVTVDPDAALNGLAPGFGSDNDQACS
jgi:spore coat protein U-like protein